MKKILFIIKSIAKSIAAGIMATASGKKWFILLLLSSNALAAPSQALLDAIRHVESGGRCVTGDNGNAVGPYQIWKILVDDVNRILKRKAYTYDDRKDEKKSREMAVVYLTHYGKGLTALEMAAIWNSGPKGAEKMKYNKNVQKYVEKIKKVMK